MSEERDRLAIRMQYLCDRLGLDKAKRQTQLAKKYGVTVTTGRNWLCGLKVPNYEIGLKMCKDAEINYEWLMAGEGLRDREGSSDLIVVRDPYLIKMVALADAVPDFARGNAIKSVDDVRQLAQQAMEEYSSKPNGTK
ncbi:MAG: hypothetical protein Q8M99_11750 [Methylotenera sp.]|nr:hypothetical protein [Methylotenera sp.]